MFHFIQSQPSIIDRFLSHIETPAFVDLLFRIIQMEEMVGGDGVIDVRRTSFALLLCSDALFFCDDPYAHPSSGYHQRASFPGSLHCCPPNIHLTSTPLSQTS
jgi:SIT4 phosphatase-associated protein